MAVLEGKFKDGDVIVAEIVDGQDVLTFRHGDAHDAAAVHATATAGAAE